MPINYINKLRLFQRDARLFLLVMSITNFAHIGMYIMIFNLYLLRLGYDIAFIGLINGTAQLAMALFSIPAGLLGRRFTNRRMLLVGVGMAFVGFGALPLAEVFSETDRPTSMMSAWLMIANALGWLGAASFAVNMNPYLMSITDAGERQHVFSVRHAIMPLAGFGGTLFAGFLPGVFANTLNVSIDGPIPYRYVLFLAASLLIPAWFVLKTTHPQIEEGQSSQNATKADTQTDTQSTKMPTGVMVFMATVVLLQIAGYNSAQTFFNVYLDDGLRLPTATIGMLVSTAQLLGVPMALLAPFLVTRWGSRNAITLGILGMAIALIPLAWIPHWRAAGVGYMGVIALFAFTSPIFAIYQQESVPIAWRSTLSGAILMTTGLGRAGIALSGGYLISNFGYSTFFTLGAILATVGGLLFWGHRQHSPLHNHT
ncbi:MAG: MFS transporter [Chloroflexota bacterium]